VYFLHLNPASYPTLCLIHSISCFCRFFSKINDDDDDDKRTGFNLVGSRFHTRSTATENAVTDLPSQSLYNVAVAVVLTVTATNHTN